MHSELSLFQGITKEEFDRMMICFEAEERCYETNETICFYEDVSDRFAYIMDGEAVILQIHFDGRQTILEYLKAGDVFGSALSAISGISGPIQVVCIRPCRLQFINYSHLIKRCSNACAFHSLLVSNALQLISRKAASLSAHLEVLAQRTTRDKILSYFYQLSREQGTDTLILPFSLSSLADYLSVDRSAMMRELKKLKEEGLIRSSGKTYTLLSP